MKEIENIESKDITEIRECLKGLSLETLASMQHVLEDRHAKLWKITGLILSEARARFRGDREFGRWCDEQNFGLHRNTLHGYRVAAEFAVHHDGQHKLPKDWNAVKDIANLPEPQQSEVLRRIAEGEERAGSRKWLREQGFIGRTDKRGKAETERSKETINAESIDLNDEEMKKVDKVIKAYIKVLDVQFEQKVDERTQAIREHLRKLQIDVANEKARLDQRSKQIVEIMTQEEFKLVRSCLHPDRARDEEEAQKLNKAFTVFNRLESTVNPKTPISKLREYGWEKVSPFYRQKKA